MRVAQQRTCDAPQETIAEGGEWMARWKQLHPQFNTVDD